MSYEEKENLKELERICKQQRQEKRLKTTLKKQDSGLAFRKWFKNLKSGKTEHQQKVAKFLREE